MPWYQKLVPESIKKSVCAYLLQRYLGQFFEEKLTRDQLNVDLYNGTGTVENISLDVQALNELGEKQNWPMEFVDGYIEKLHISIPWASILKDTSFVEVKGLKLTIQPKQRCESATSMFESMWNSMTSSMQLAEECAKHDAANLSNNAQPYEGIELFAQTIDSILSRVQVKFIDTVIQMEHVPKESATGVGILININSIEYSDEAGNDPSAAEADDYPNSNTNKAYIVQSFTTKKFSIQGISLFTVEFSKNEHGAENKEEGEETETPTQNAGSYAEMSSPLWENRHNVLFGKLNNKQEIRIRLKQSENLNGPKVFIEVNLGSLILFLSPRQVHVLIELANGISCPDIEDHSNVPARTKLSEKPMTNSDYQKIEHELQQHLYPYANIHATGLQATHGWSTAPLDESDTEDNFLPLKNPAGMCDSTLSGVNSSMDSSMSSSMTSSASETSQRTRRRISNIDSDPSAEISHFHIRLASVALVLLHEDILMQSAELEQVLVPSTVQQMNKIVENFYTKLGYFVLTAHNDADFENARSVFEKACNLNHLRLFAAPVQIEGDEKTTSSAFSITGHLTIAKLELLECLYQSSEKPAEYVPLLTFNKPNTTSQNSSSCNTAKPCLGLSFKHVEKTSKNVPSRRNFGPKTEISISLNKCSVELDITIFDRITALLNSQPICVIEKSSYNIWNTSSAPISLNCNPVESKTDLKVTSELINVKLRFPIPDFRPAHDMNRTPWWKRHVRQDYLSLLLSDVLLQTSKQTNQSYQEYNIQSRGLDILYYETENSSPLPIAKCGFDEKYLTSMQDVLLHSRLNIKIFPEKKFELEECNEPEDLMSHSIYGAFINQTNKQPGPFSAKKVVHESDTPHAKPKKDDPEELIIPGDKQEIDEFIKLTTSCAQIQVEVSLPTVSMQLITKHVYELIYNRINNDLLLWEPSAPRPKTNFYEKTNYAPLPNFPMEGQDTYALCKSAIQYESDSESEADSEESNGVFYSTYDRLKASQKHQQQLMQKAEPKGQSAFVLNLQIGQGLLCMHTPVRDSATNNVIPGQHGEFLLNVENANVFVVSGYKGDKNLGYVCVQVQNAQLHHCDMATTANTNPPLKDISSTVGRHLHQTIYKSDNGMLADFNKRGGNREMLTVAVKVQANHETHHVKCVRVAIGINKATLNHKMTSEPNSFISQIIDFFNVQDYPIPGYYSKDVLTELHLHLWDCAIDYRPLHLPLRTAVTLGNFSMSSHISATANTSTLIFIAEECGLYISDKYPPRNGVASTVAVDLKRDYVNVMELGLFELSLKTNDKKNGLNPHIDLRASNNILHIRTCADSGKALMQLITYIANDGDTGSVDPPENYSNNVGSPSHEPEQELISVEPQDISNLSKSQHQSVNELLGDAMKESDVIEEGSDVLTNAGAKLFFFPDENQMLHDNTAKLPQVKCDLGDVTFVSNLSSDDDDFFIVGNEAGLGLFPKNGLPEIKWLTGDPLRVVENHFSIPIGKTDLLKPPKYYPTPTMRYTLCEMSIVWNMYGGHDFKSSDKDNKKTVNFSDRKLNDNVGFCNSPKGGVFINSVQNKKTSNMSWIVRGGANRDHNVLMELQLNKVRFQHELYPENTTQASRQVLIISDVEIRDRLESSQINKFLYQHTSQARPKQAHAHMIVIKALHIRPDQKLKTQECCLKISLLPLRLNIDQDSLLFLITFFNELGGGSSSKEDEEILHSKHSTPTHQPPVMTVSSENDETFKKQAQQIVDENLLILLEENINNDEKDEEVSLTNNSTGDAPVYFRNVIFSPDVLIRLDYHGKRVDMTHGSLPGLLMGLGQLNCSELRLRRISHRHGLLGFDKLMAFLLQEWLNDIKKNQLPSLLGGVGPMHSFIQLFYGIKDLFWLPIEQYQKDGRIVRGLQRGANSFTTSTAMAALELTSRIIHLIQITAETAYDMLSPGPSLKRIAKSKGRRKRYNQPQDIREGVTNAYMLVKEGIGETADNIVQVASHEREQKGYSGAVGGVLRQIPPTILKPIIIASEATNNVIGGMRSQLEPDSKRESSQKWRSNDE